MPPVFLLFTSSSNSPKLNFTPLQIGIKNMFGLFGSKSKITVTEKLGAVIAKHTSVDLSVMSKTEQDYLDNKMEEVLKSDVDLIKNSYKNFKLSGDEDIAANWVNLIFIVQNIESLKGSETDLTKGLGDFVFDKFKMLNPFFNAQCRSALEELQGDKTHSGKDISTLVRQMDYI